MARTWCEHGASVVRTCWPAIICELVSFAFGLWPRVNVSDIDNRQCCYVLVCLCCRVVGVGWRQDLVVPLAWLLLARPSGTHIHEHSTHTHKHTRTHMHSHTIYRFARRRPWLTPTHPPGCAAIDDCPFKTLSVPAQRWWPGGGWWWPSACPQTCPPAPPSESLSWGG